MHPHVVVVGTNHAYQWADASSHPADIQAFCAFLEEVCQSNGAVSITEEMSLDSLALRNRSESSVFALCRRLGLIHAYCDPSEPEQNALGIINDGNIRLFQGFNGWSDAEVNRRISDEYLKRERIWVSRLHELASWPSVFVCGSEHIGRLPTLLAESGLTVKVAAENWCA